TARVPHQARRRRDGNARRVSALRVSALRGRGAERRLAAMRVARRAVRLRDRCGARWAGDGRSRDARRARRGRRRADGRRAMSGDGARLEALYQEMILDHYRRPRNKGALDGATGDATLKNPLCGDELTVQVAVEGDVLDDVRFGGRGCSISQASASMM